MSPLGLERRQSSNSPPSLRVRNARLHDCKYSFPESVMERPLGLRCTRRTPRCFSRRVNARLTVEVGRCISFAAAVSVPACATATNVRTSLRSGSFIGNAFLSRPHKGGNGTILRGFVRLREPRHAANLPRVYHSIALVQSCIAPLVVSRRCREAYIHLDLSMGRNAINSQTSAEFHRHLVYDQIEADCI